MQASGNTASENNTINKSAGPARIALAGNPNCGKTTIFNALTGLKYKVANYPGVTVEKKEGKVVIPEIGPICIVDLPGIYSLSGNSIDEAIAAKALFGQVSKEPLPDLIISVVDASNLERNLYLTSQLLDLQIPIILAVNMTDIAEKDGLTIRYEILSKILDVPVVAISASRNLGLDNLKNEIQKALNKLKVSSKAYAWLQPASEFEMACQRLGLTEIEDLGIQDLHIAKLIGAGLLAEAYSPKYPRQKLEIEKERQHLLTHNTDCFSYEASARYLWINKAIKSCCFQERPETRKLYEKVDEFITHKLWGTLTFLFIMAFIFQSIFLWASYPMDFIDSSFVKLQTLIGETMESGPLRSLITDGVIAGVGSVVIFIPQIAILFFFLGLLEDSGYLSRAAFLMDKVMRKFGLQGRSFIPLLSSFACAIPGIMSTRTIPSFADRMTTILVAPLMSCSARLPVYTLLIAAFIPNIYLLGFISVQGLVLLGMYLLGVVGAVVVAWILKFSLLRGEPAIFVMEMPRFRSPSAKLVLREVLDRIIIFIKNAGTIILACSIVLWFLASYPQGEVKNSYAGQIGTFMEPVIKPLGFNWEIGVGILASFAAREVFISSLSTVYNIQDSSNTSESILDVLKGKKETGSFTISTALSLMVFYVFACQCMSTLAVCRRETGSWWWVTFMFSYMTVMAYSAAYLTFNLSNFFLLHINR